MLCARKINDELNIMEGMHTNAMFISVWLTIVGGQILMVVFGGWAMKVHLDGLTGTQWLITVAVGSVSLIINVILKFVPDGIWPTMGDENEEDVKAAKQDYSNLLKFRKTKDLSSSMRQGKFIQNKEGGSFK